MIHKLKKKNIGTDDNAAGKVFFSLYLASIYPKYYSPLLYSL